MSACLYLCAIALLCLNGARAHPAVDGTTAGNSADSELREKLYAKMWSYFVNAHEYKNFTLEQAKHHIDEVEDWVAPRELQENFPYYLSGYDRDNQPIWIIEVGKYNIREQIERGPAYTKNLTEYLFQGIHRAMKSMIEKDTPEKEVRRAVLIADCKGLDLIQTAHVPTVTFLLTLLRRYDDFISQVLARGIIINMNYVASVLFDSIRPILGKTFEKFELYGSKDAKWKEALVKALPIETIPTWYGGRKDYKPVQVYG